MRGGRGTGAWGLTRHGHAAAASAMWSGQDPGLAAGWRWSIRGRRAGRGIDPTGTGGGGDWVEVGLV
jgi:hypothetical protein